MPTDGNSDQARLLYSGKPCTAMGLNWPRSMLVVFELGFEVFINIINPTACLLSKKLMAVLKVIFKKYKITIKR